MHACIHRTLLYIKCHHPADWPTNAIQVIWKDSPALAGRFANTQTSLHVILVRHRTSVIHRVHLRRIFVRQLALLDRGHVAHPRGLEVRHHDDENLAPNTTLVAHVVATPQTVSLGTRNVGHQLSAYLTVLSRSARCHLRILVHCHYVLNINADTHAHACTHSYLHINTSDLVWHTSGIAEARDRLVYNPTNPKVQSKTTSCNPCTAAESGVFERCNQYTFLHSNHGM